MNLLLDTHAWLWQLLQPECLSRRVQQMLNSSEHQLFLSPISVWETLVLAEHGKLSLAPDPITWVRAALSVSPTATAELSHDVAMKSRELPGLRHNDPADRFLIATAIVNELTLVTADRRIRDYRKVQTLW